MLLRLITLPVTGPVKGSLWIIDQILRAAEAETGPASVRDEIAAAHMAYDRGEITSEQLTERVDDLVDELLIRRQLDEGG